VSNNLKRLVATLRHEVESCSAEPGRSPSELWSTLDELDQELDERSPTEHDMAELTAVVRELRQVAKRHENLLRILAAALNTLIWPYWRKRQYEHVVPLAEERVSIYRSLAATTASQGNKVCHREALDVLGRTFFLLHRNHQALTVMEEAVAMARDELAAGYAASEDLAKHLSLMSSCLIALERYDDAVAAAEEEVSLETKLRLAGPGGDRTRLARALGNLGGCLSAGGRHSAAVAAMKEAVALYRESAADGALDAR
jgi:tetratricopeptide (TPR) repeat protein